MLTHERSAKKYSVWLQAIPDLLSGTSPRCCRLYGKTTSCPSVADPRPRLVTPTDAFKQGGGSTPAPYPRALSNCCSTELVLANLVSGFCLRSHPLVLAAPGVPQA